MELTMSMFAKREHYLEAKCKQQEAALAELHAKVQKLERERDSYKRACDEWAEKTEWVLRTAQPHELGMHRADVLRERIARAAAQPVPRYKIGYLTDQWGERSSTPGGIPDPAGDWVRYDDHVATLASAAQPTSIGGRALRMVLQGMRHPAYPPYVNQFADAIENALAISAQPAAAPAAVAHQGVVAWPVMPPSKGQSPVLFEDGYAEGWAKCLEACRAALATAPTTQSAPQPAVQQGDDFWPVDGNASRKQLIKQIGQMNYRLTALRQQNAGLVARVQRQAEALRNPQSAAAPAAQGEALTDTYIQQVPDKCDRIVWRGSYYHLPINAARAAKEGAQP